MEEKKELSTKEKRTLMIVSLAIVIALVFGISYAYFMAVGESAEQTITTANLSLTFDDGTAIVNATDISPLETDDVLTSATKKTFTISRPDTSKDIYAKIELTDISVPEALAEYDLKWALYNGTTPVTTGDFGGKTSGNIVLATNQLINSTEGTTYNLYIWINETGLNQATMMGQTFKATIKASGTNIKQNTLASILLGENNSNVLPGEYDFDNDFKFESVTDGDSVYDQLVTNYTYGLYAMKDDVEKSEMGFPTYYYRGDIENNYVKFGTYKTTDGGNTVGNDIVWRIIRINEDGSIRLISQNAISESLNYNPNKLEYINDIGETYYDADVRYRNSDKSKNEVDTAKDVVENWYNENIGATNLTNKVVTSTFCNKILRNEWDEARSYPLGYVCPAEEPKIYEKVGLITKDEATLAGMNESSGEFLNYNTYLDDLQSFWTMSLRGADEIYVKLYNSDEGSHGYTAVSIYEGTDFPPLHAVINLSPDVIVTGGDGLSADTAYTIE